MKIILLVILLLIIFYQDLRYRAVIWFLFPLLFCAAIWYNYPVINYETLFLNILFVLFLLLMLTIYVSAREKKLTTVWNGFFSWGDILFIIAITPLFDFIGYIYFFTFGTLLTLFIHAVVVRFSKNKTVPYAGYLSVAVILFLFFEGPVHSFFSLLNGSR